MPGVCLLTYLETPECRAWKCVKIIRKRKMGAEEGIKIKDTGQKNERVEKSGRERRKDTREYAI